MIVINSPVPAPVLRRQVIEMVADGELTLTSASGETVTLRLVEKSGRRARLVFELPDEIRIDQRK